MQRLNAAACLLFAFLSGAPGCLAAGPLKVEVVQTHTGVKLGSNGVELVSDSDSIWSRCSGTSGSYSRQFGFHCENARQPLPGQSPGGRSYAFFYDVRVIMPDEAHLVFHCSTVVDRDCQGFPEYPEATSVECLDFVYSGSAYKDCTAAGHSSERIGVYRASLHGGRMTIFGSNWRRSYMQYGTWQLERPGAQDARMAQSPKPAEDPQAASDLTGTQDPKPATDSATTQDPKPSSNGAAPQDPKPSPDPAASPDPKSSSDPTATQDPKPSPNPATPQDPKPDAAATQDPKPAQTSEVKPASVPEDKSTQPAPPATAPSSAAAILSAAADQVIDPRIIEQAKAGDPVAQYRLGYDYFLGHGEPVDYVQAAIWWRKAADQGYPQAQNNLGVLYNSGKGVPQSFSEAYFWQNLAAARTSGPLQAQFAKNRDESASKLWFIARLRVQQRAAKWAAEHPVQPRSREPIDAKRGDNP